jgi:hypothetical protein
MKEGISGVFNKWKENRVEGWYMQVIGGDPFLIRWVQGKGKPRKRITLIDKGRWVELCMVDENIFLTYPTANFTVDSMYEVMSGYVKGERPTEAEIWVSKIPVDESRVGESVIVFRP